MVQRSQHSPGQTALSPAMSAVHTHLHPRSDTLTASWTTPARDRPARQTRKSQPTGGMRFTSQPGQHHDCRRDARSTSHSSRGSHPSRWLRTGR